MTDNPQTTERARIVAAVLCRQHDTAQCRKCGWCDGTAEMCVAWDDYVDEAEEILAALDQKESADAE
jgi:uncharacterized protein (DUF779 family)